MTGWLRHMSGPFADAVGPGSVAAARMAVEQHMAVAIDLARKPVDPRQSNGLRPLPPGALPSAPENWLKRMGGVLS